MSAIPNVCSTPSRPHILVLSPDLETRQELVQQLDRAGFPTEPCASSEEAVACLDSTLYDLVVEALPSEQDATELGAYVHQRHPTLPIVHVSAKGALDAEPAPALHHAFARMLLDEGSARLIHLVERAHQFRKQRIAALGLDQDDYIAAKQKEQLDQLLTDALAHMYMVFQPIVRARSSCVVGYEALLRTTTARFARPRALLNAAEMLDRKSDVDARVRTLIAQEFQTSGQWRTFFVNFDIEELDRQVLGTDADPLLPYASRIVVEFSQNFPIPVRAHMLSTLNQMRDHGYRIAVGSIHSTTSSLVRMRVLGPDIYKLGAGVVRGCDRSVSKQRYIADVVEMAHGEGALVVAQGVERGEELQGLIDLGCDMVQGFLLGIPRAILD